jgi:hypothetical protein
MRGAEAQALLTAGSAKVFPSVYLEAERNLQHQANDYVANIAAPMRNLVRTVLSTQGTIPHFLERQEQLHYMTAFS